MPARAERWSVEPAWFYSPLESLPFLHSLFSLSDAKKVPFYQILGVFCYFPRQQPHRDFLFAERLQTFNLFFNLRGTSA